MLKLIYSSAYARILMAVLISLMSIPSNSFGANVGVIDDDDEPAKPKITQKKTEAGFTHKKTCPEGNCGDNKPKPIEEAKKVKRATEDSTISGGSCTDRILRAMRTEASCWAAGGAGGCGVMPAASGRKYRRGTFKGSCGRAVASGLTRAGINNGSRMLHARDMGGPLRSLGFVDVREPGMTPATAPVGAILVYGRALVRGCRGLGSIYGHVEVKDYGGRYLYDGNANTHIQNKMGSLCRPLIGVYLPTNVRGC